ncbi:TPA: hypothetical protein QB579_000283 [Pasteurella multocida]|nr:hypothetical protein [Pasteurella multocida]
MYKYRWVKEEDGKPLDVTSLKNEDGDIFEFDTPTDNQWIALLISEDKEEQWSLYNTDKFIVLHVWRDGDLSTRERLKIYDIGICELQADWLEDDEDPNH